MKNHTSFFFNHRRKIKEERLDKINGILSNLTVTNTMFLSSKCKTCISTIFSKLKPCKGCTETHCTKCLTQSNLTKLDLGLADLCPSCFKILQQWKRVLDRQETLAGFLPDEKVLLEYNELSDGVCLLELTTQTFKDNLKDLPLLKFKENGFLNLFKKTIPFPKITLDELIEVRNKTWDALDFVKLKLRRWTLNGWSKRYPKLQQSINIGIDKRIKHCLKIILDVNHKLDHYFIFVGTTLLRDLNVIENLVECRNTREKIRDDFKPWISDIDVKLKILPPLNKIKKNPEKFIVGMIEEFMKYIKIPSYFTHSLDALKKLIHKK